jgi:small-conductance mechanosensitive channel
LVHSLERWALQTKQKYDDLLVQILKLFGSFFIVAFSGAILLVDFQSDIKQATGIDNILLPYTIVVSVLTAIIGYSTQEGVQNFFGGLLLQIEKPFELGDRIVLGSGEICDVRTLGIRSTTFYNILENTEISIPNRLVSNQPITNLSRPNLELRVSTKLHIPFDKKGTSLQRTESVLLDIAAKEEEIDFAWLSRGEKNRDEEKITGRKSVEERVMEIRNSYTNLGTASVRRLSGSAKPIEVFDEEKGIFKKLSQVTQLREQYDRLRETTNRKSIYSRYEILKNILQRFGEIGEFIYSLGTVDPDARVSDAYLQLVDEVSIEPSVYSQYMITEEGRAYLEVTLRVYTTHLERRFEVSHKINKEIQKRFAEEGIKILSIGA